MNGLYEYEDGYQGSFLGAYEPCAEERGSLDDFAEAVFEEFENEFDSFLVEYEDDRAKEVAVESIRDSSRFGFFRIDDDGCFVECQSDLDDIKCFPAYVFEVY